jgi:hypothetical protein
MNTYHNNQKLMDNLRTGIDHLGLLINEDETIVSTEYLNYGKLVTLFVKTGSRSRPSDIPEPQAAQTTKYLGWGLSSLQLGPSASLWPKLLRAF